jgi:hypothetical protein
MSVNKFESMMNVLTKNSRKWMPEFKTSASYFQLFNRALDNLELNKLEEKTFRLSVVLDAEGKNKKAGL